MKSLFKIGSRPVKLIILTFFSAVLLFAFLIMEKHSLHLSFSDGAKFALVARNLLMDGEYSSQFSFYDSELALSTNGFFSARGVLPLMPLLIVLNFFLFGVSDFSVIFTSAIFYLLLIIFIFLLSKRIFKSDIVGLLSAITVAFNIDYLNYAISGGAETLLAFLFLLSLYLFSFKKRGLNLLSFAVLVLIYFTKTQGFIYILGSLLFWLLHNFNRRKVVMIFVTILAAGFLFDYFVISPYSVKYPFQNYIYGITNIGKFATTQHFPGSSVSDSLRGVTVTGYSVFSILKKLFYNLYNFYKLIPNYLSPFLFPFFIISIFVWKRNSTEDSLKISSIFTITLTFVVTALTIPFYRYLHPVIPLIYMFACAYVVKIVNLIFKNTNNKKRVVLSLILVLFFCVIQTLGYIFLDSRYKGRNLNKDKQLAHIKLSKIIEENTNEKDVVLTNLDTWGSWYGNRRTVWFPTSTNDIGPEKTNLLFDAVYLTSYLMNDENYYMGEEWRQIFYNPEKPENLFIAENYELKGVYKIEATETYENQSVRAVLLVRKKD